MLQRLVLAFVILAVSAFAGTVTGAKTTFKITLADGVAVNGTDLKAGDCRLVLGENKITLEQGSVSVAMAAKVETVATSFDGTVIFYVSQGSKRALSEIRLGGTKTKITLP